MAQLTKVAVIMRLSWLFGEILIALMKKFILEFRFSPLFDPKIVLLKVSLLLLKLLYNRLAYLTRYQ